MIIEESQYGIQISRWALEKRRLVVRVSKPTLSKFGGEVKTRWAVVNTTAFEADSVEQAEEYALAILEACVAARQLNAQFKVDYLSGKFDDNGPIPK